ncbi:MAG TPA: OmpH family outer membrane protein [Cyclobacteriaceae bacterium]|nr:OmpH family outer membrane protein [Cyclobacteriaceae bacterium]
MKNLSLVINGVLLIAVAVLYYLHFSSRPGSAQGGSVFASGDKPLIAFINSDSVLQNYEYLEVKRKELEEKTKKMEQEYRTRTEGLQTEINNYQRNVGNMTLSQVRAVEEDLQRKQQNLRMYEQTLTQELMNEESKLNKELYDRVTAFLKKYGQKNGLHVVLKFDPSSDVLFAGDSLDITNEVIRGLNQEYQQEGGTAASDTTTTR